MFTLTSALTGAIPIIITKLLEDKYPNYKLWKIFLGILIGQTIISIVMVPIFISLSTGKNTIIFLQLQ